MAFFGITALGPPNIFKSSLINALGITVYTDEEFERAFAKVDRDNSGFITPNEVEELLYEAYGYPALDEEVELFMKEFDANADGKVSMAEFKACLSRMRETLKGQDKVAKEYTSYNQMQQDRYKHTRMAGNTEDKYKVPMTFNQSIGFKCEHPRNKDLVKMDRHPITKCAETKYADEMIRTGFPS